MRVYKDERLTELYCNKCGKQIKIENEVIREGNFSVDYRWDYFSGKDGRRHKFDLCESCYDEIIKNFEYPVEEADYNEFV
ncbi:MAG: hypothetical protein HFG29_07060 [Eubacterium sp.]|nr:hypothetical protein [Eubacterium sp.]